MSDKHEFNSQKNNSSSRKGSHLTFLTPDRKLLVPPLKTTLTRPQNVSLANLSPFNRHIVNPFVHNSPYIQTSPFLSEVSRTDIGAKPGTLEKVYKSNAGIKHRADSFEENETDATAPEEVLNQTKVCSAITQNKSIENDKIVNINVSNVFNEEQSLDMLNDEGFRKVNVSDIERQIIPNNETDVEKSPGTFFDLKPHNVFCESSLLQKKQAEQDCSEKATHDNVNHSTKNIVTDEGQRRRYTPSFCSSCSCDDSMTAQSRCSVCDGCSSSTCNSSYSTVELSHMRPSGDCTEDFFHPHEMPETKIESLLESHLSFDELDAGLLKPLVKNVDESEVKGNPNKLSLSTGQLIFLLLRMVLAKYKHLAEEVAMEKQMSKSQRQSIACLIQSVVLLSRRVKTTSDQWQKAQIQLQVIQTDHERLRRQNRKIIAMCCFLVVLNICRVPAVKDRLFKIVKLFGVVENVRKINRMRKMIAENWRNIPSLLTDFWRIFIFRSTTRLKNS